MVFTNKTFRLEEIAEALIIGFHIIEHISPFITVQLVLQVNLDMTDSMGPGKLVRHMQNPLYTYDEYMICIGLGPSILSVICKNLSYTGPSYPSSPVLFIYIISGIIFFPFSHYR